jgi:hypothetical protein
MEAHEQERGAQELAAALQRNTNILTLSLGDVEDVFLLPILSGLELNTHIETLILIFGVEDLSRAAATGIQRLVESTATIDELKLAACRFQTETFLPISQGLINSESITDVKFVNCSFQDEGSTLLFKSVLQTKWNGCSSL